jgi:hypothetical protein
MNPYLENDDAWEDFHDRFIVALANGLEQVVGENYLVKIEVRLHIHELSEEERRYFGKADVGLTGEAKVSPAGSAAVAAAAPMQLLLPAVEVRRISYLEIRDSRDRRVVTAIELLSPANKTPGPDYDTFVAKRRTLLASHTHFVEIDLRRGGARPYPPELPTCDYYVLVSRYEDRPRVGLWPLRLADRLPAIPIPRASPDAAVAIDLQELLHKVYDAANYGKFIYAETPQPPLSPDDAAWAQQFVPVEAK